MSAPAAHKEDMTTLTIAPAPAAGARFRKQSTGRTWHVDRITESGLVALTEEYYGEGCDMREYVTADELAADYAPAP
jgi:hypothetical protein